MRTFVMVCLAISLGSCALTEFHSAVRRLDSIELQLDTLRSNDTFQLEADLKILSQVAKTRGQLKKVQTMAAETMTNNMTSIDRQMSNVVDRVNYPWRYLNVWWQ